jgi:repressor LexA
MPTPDGRPRLTTRQQDIFEFVRDRLAEQGRSPSVREIAARFGIRSPNGVLCHLEALEKKGVVARESARGWRLRLADPP